MRLPKLTALGLIVLVGLVLRILWLFVAQPVPVSDFLSYQNLGGWLLDLGQFGYPEPEALRLPGYPAFLALLMLASRSVFWLSLCNVLLSTALIFLLHELALQLGRGNPRYAQSSALVCALYPTFIFYSPVLASEHLFVLMFLGSLLLLVRASRAGVPSIASTVVAGLLLGASVLTRGEGLFYLPVCLLAIFFSSGTLRARAMRGVLIVLCAVVMIAPWSARNVRLFGPGGIGLAGGSGLTFYESHGPNCYCFNDMNNPDLKAPTLAESAKKGWVAGLKNLREDPVHVVRRMPIALSNQYAPGDPPYAMLWGSVKRYSLATFERQAIPGLHQLDHVTKAGYWLLLILTASSFVVWRTLPVTSWALLWATIGANWFCYCVVFYAMERYRFTAEVFACMLAGATVYGVVHQLPPSLRPTAGRKGCIDD